MYLTNTKVSLHLFPMSTRVPGVRKRLEQNDRYTGQLESCMIAISSDYNLWRYVVHADLDMGRVCYSIADVFSPYMWNCMKMTASSKIVPRDPMSQGRFLRKYCFSTEWRRIWNCQ